MAHYKSPNKEWYVDTDFVQKCQRLSGVTLKHLGFGEFTAVTPRGEVEFDRMRGKDFPGQSGRSHKLYGEDDAVGWLVHEMYLHNLSEAVPEGKTATDMSRRVTARYLEATQEMVALSLPRDSYLPTEVRGTKPVVPDGTDLAIWTFTNSKGRPAAIDFQGNQGRPLWYLYFHSEAERSSHIEHTVKTRREAIERKRQEMEDRRNYQHSMQVGDVYYTSWGYDQTNVDFYEVTDLRGKMVAFRAIGSEIVDGNGYQENVVPRKGHYISPPMLVRPTGPSVKIEGHYAHKWDGKPVYQTDPRAGH